MIVLFYLIVALAAAAGAFALMDTLVNAESAPQQAAGAAMALAISVIPYVFVRAIDLIVSRRQMNELISIARELKPKPLQDQAPQRPAMGERRDPKL
ncbi:MAG: hypothetical protein WEC00_00040 [Dongiaceae bacterium]